MAKVQAKIPLSVDDFEVMCTIGSGSYGLCKKVMRIKDKKVILDIEFYSIVSHIIIAFKSFQMVVCELLFSGTSSSFQMMVCM